MIQKEKESHVTTSSEFVLFSQIAMANHPSNYIFYSFLFFSYFIKLLFMKPTLRDNEISFSYIHFKNGSLPSRS